jgi:hypothetical protein
MRRRTFVFACVFLLVSGAGYYCWSAMPSYSVSRALAAEVKHGPGIIVDMAQVAPFAWDHMFVFGPYAGRERVEASIGFPWNGVKWSNIESSDTINLVVLVRDGAIVRWFDHSRGEGDLLNLADLKGYTRQDAKFRVERRQDGRLILFR